MNATRIADTVRTRDLLAFARDYQAGSPHSLYPQANSADQIENDLFIRNLQSAPDMSLAGLQAWADEKVRQDAVTAGLLVLSTTCFVISGALLGGPTGAAVVGGGIALGIATAGVAGHQKRMRDLSQNLRTWEAVLDARAAKTP